MRNVLLIMSLDHFPAFKDRTENHSIGCLAASIANYSLRFRSSADLIIPLALLGGPHESGHTCIQFAPVVEEINRLSIEGKHDYRLT